jgi:hypothetical protein
LSLHGTAIATRAEPPSAAAVEFFENKVRPILATQCHQCHGPQKQKGGLRLDSRTAVLQGGDRGPAIRPGKPDASLLIDAIRHGELLQMPPKKKLAATAIADLTAWVKMGAPWPDRVVGVRPTLGADASPFTPEERSFWAFQPPDESAIPAVRNTAWPSWPLDQFILAQLEANGLQPAPPADKRTWLRRATFDLIGLPPTPAEMNAFLADSSPDAFARVVDRLLASPHYGERWGRHWLDVARYADSNGMDENLAFGNAWRYRDYVVGALNRDKPYDQFVREQLAGDLLDASGEEAAGREHLIATGFLSLGPKMLAEDDPVKMEMDIVDEQIDTVGRTFMGLTLGCARCHDHKFDPVSTADYYALAGIFKSTKSMEHFRVVARWQERPIGSRQEIERWQAFEKERARKKADLERNKGKDPKIVDRLAVELRTFESTAPSEAPRAMAVSEGQVGNTRIHVRGSHWTLGKEVARQFPRIVAGPYQPPINARHSGRLELASWLTRSDHPLSSRVMVNRIWRGHFGAGLVRSMDNFGKLGERPVNQPLLDWLAVHFVRYGWSLKAMHRLIMLSSTYRMSSAYDARAAQVDPENRLHWRMNRRRLEVECVRDALLAVSGQLDPAMGGSLLQTRNGDYVASTFSVNPTNYDSRRRSIYLPVVRSALYEVFQAFDFADPSVPNGERETTTVAPQALFMMNSPLVQEQSRQTATALLEQAGLDDAGHVCRIYERAYGRPPTAQEVARALDFVGRCEEYWGANKGDPRQARLRAWQSLCRAIVAANEFIYLD